jgi:hypothetical protein
VFTLKQTLLTLTLFTSIGFSAHAEIINGSFETGLSSWSKSDSPIATSTAFDFGSHVGLVSPTVGVLAARLSTGGTGSDAPSVLAFMGATSTDFANAYPYGGTAPAGWVPGGQLAILYQSFAITAGDELSFDSNFVGLDGFVVGGGSDWAWWALKIDSNPYHISMLGNQLGYVDGRGQVWKSNTYVAPYSGTATLYFAANGDVAYPSELWIDNVNIVNTTAVPEPSSLASLSIAALFFGMKRWRNRRINTPTIPCI